MPLLLSKHSEFHRRCRFKALNSCPTVPLKGLCPTVRCLLLIVFFAKLFLIDMLKRHCNEIIHEKKGLRAVFVALSRTYR